MFGRLPFVGQNITETFEAIKQDELQFDSNVECSEELRDLLVKVKSWISLTLLRYINVQQHDASMCMHATLKLCSMPDVNRDFTLKNLRLHL